MTKIPRHRIRLPQLDFSRERESDVYFVLDHEDGRAEHVRFHDYDRIYSLPGLYEQIFYERLKCDSPRFLAMRMREVLAAAGDDLNRQRVLDFGAGNGMMGEELAHYGVSRLVGADISVAAKDALWRDRPGIYDAYYVGDLSRHDDALMEQLGGWDFNCLTTIAALGYDDIPVAAFHRAFNLIADGGWIAFNIKETFLGQSDESGLALFIKRLVAGEFLQLYHLERYRHRISIEGNPLHYCAVIGRKLAAMPDSP
ncbi:methyltransferase domain-containing protein [Luteimonas sp. RD2P54]|uniref:Methyltransferase domain-containing protein n=1 Tax=Luteimonas endophytica TaxID=3042023 RepID=A0ABT6J757_9GAMM|nr:methyltransferase domain-containing protein [Luteimonas endophytica]MDH5822655.1 methyltransferase domain-containing protein [Luteimonas endophytica]